MKKFKILLFLSALFVASSCEDFLAKEPVNIITDDVVIIDQASALSAVYGIYDALQSAEMYHNQTVANPGVLSDELIHSGSFPTVNQMDFNDVLPTNVTIQNMWARYYAGIFRANVLLERIEDITIAEATKQQYIAEAKFLRALMHFDLARFWGNVPIATTSALAELSTLTQSTQSQVYDFVITELTEAAALLGTTTFTNRNRATRLASLALLARVNLYNGDLAAAGNFANQVITSGSYTLAANYEDIFQGNNQETIFEVFSSVNDQNGIAFWFRKNGRYEYAPSSQLVSAFEAGDARLDMIADAATAAPEAVKYVDLATGTDKAIVLRLSEMYLIRAEANLGTPGADADLNALRNRAGLGDITGATLDDVLQERFVELSFEGHRWFDLIRTGRVNDVMSAINPQTWDATDVLLPIPQRELDQNPNLNQNPGYSVSGS